MKNLEKPAKKEENKTNTHGEIVHHLRFQCTHKKFNKRLRQLVEQNKIE